MDQETRESFAQVFKKLDDLRKDMFDFQLAAGERMKGIEAEAKAVNTAVNQHCADTALHIKNGGGIKIGAKEVIYILLTLAAVIGVLTELLKRG